MQTYRHTNQNAARASGGQSKNLPVCRLHFSLVWQAIVDEGVKNYNQTLFFFIILDEEELGLDCAQSWKQSKKLQVTQSLLCCYVLRYNVALVVASSSTLTLF